MDPNMTNNPAQVAGARFVTMFESIASMQEQESDQRLAIAHLGLAGFSAQTFVSMDKAAYGAHSIQQLLMGSLVARDANEVEHDPIASLNSWQAGGLLSALDVLLEVLRDGLIELEQEGQNRRRNAKEKHNAE